MKKNTKKLRCNRAKFFSFIYVRKKDMLENMFDDFVFFKPDGYIEATLFSGMFLKYLAGIYERIRRSFLRDSMFTSL